MKDVVVESYIGRAIGRLTARLSGLNAVYLPPEAGLEIGAEIVREANLSKPRKPPFAILISEDADQAGRNLPVVSRAESIRYRQGERLVVVPTTSVDLASFDGAFREVMGSGFPATALPAVSVDALSRELVVLLAEWAEVDPGDISIDELSAKVSLCLRAIADILVAEQDGAAAWNAKWFAAADRGAMSLAQTIAWGAANDSFATFDEAVTTQVWACFGLPAPADGEQWGKKYRAADFVQAFQDVWGSEESIALYTKETQLTGSTDSSVLGACADAGWDGLDDLVVGTHSPLLGLQQFVTGEQSRLNAFSDVGEQAFFRAGAVARDFQVLDASSASMAVSASQKTVYLVKSSQSGNDRLETERIAVVLPFTTRPPEEKVEASRLALQAAGTARISDSFGPRLTEEGIRFEVSVQLPAPERYALKKVGLALEVGPNDPLFGYVQAASVAVHVMPPVNEAVVSVEWTSAKRTGLRMPAFEEPESGADTANVVEGELKPDKYHRVVVYSPGREPVPAGITLEPVEGRADWFIGDLLPNAGVGLTIGDLEWRLVPGGASGAPQSLLVAAIDKAIVDPDDPDPTIMESLRGQLESLMASKLDDDSFVDCLGHIALSGEIPTGVASADVTDRGVLMPQGMTAFWESEVDLTATADSDPEAQRAQDAFVQAWLACIDMTTARDTGGSSKWPSKRSLRQCAATDLIETMLDRYADMLEAAEDLDEFSRFRAAFPFSASVWGKVEEDFLCTAVLLSPWHPIRLAWLAGVEATLWGAQGARALAGVVEGWRFPMTGPSPAFDQMLAVPIDSGEGQIFVGWSMLVRLSTGVPRHLRPPSIAAGLDMPGSAPSGLTGTAADAAMRDFKRANPHLPSLTIDLASSARGPRLAEIDESVIKAVRKWSKGGEPVLGVRILDSLNREGDLPRGKLTEMFRADSTTSVSWSRYGDSHDSDVDSSDGKSNLRLLQAAECGSIAIPSLETPPACWPAMVYVASNRA